MTTSSMSCWWETFLEPQLSLALEEGPSLPAPGQGKQGTEPVPSISPSCKGPGRGVYEAPRDAFVILRAWFPGQAGQQR